MPRLAAHRAHWIAILAVALGVRLAAGVWWESRIPAGQQFTFGDSDSYWQLGRAIAAGESYEYRSPEARMLRTPGYPIVLSSVFVVFGNDAPVMAARALSAVFGTMAVAIVGWWTAELFNPRAATIAGWIAALYPGAVSMGAFVLSEAVFCPFMLLQLVLWGLAWRARSGQRAVVFALAGGVAAGVATLVRPSWLLFLPFAVVVVLVIDRRRGRQLVVGLAMTCGLVACMLPWWIRNARLTGHFVPTTLQVGASLYDGLSPAADGSSDMSFVPQFTLQQRAADRAAGAAGQGEVFEYALDQRLRQAALDWAAAHPGRVAQLAWAKWVRMWNVWPNEPSLRRWPIRLLVACTYVPLLGCALAGAWRYTRQGWPVVLAWLPAVYFTLLHMVFVGSIRYREPAILALVVLAAGVLAGASRAAAGGQATEARGAPAG